MIDYSGEGYANMLDLINKISVADTVDEDVIFLVLMD
jgi:hypothetical protein